MRSKTFLPMIALLLCCGWHRVTGADVNAAQGAGGGIHLLAARLKEAQAEVRSDFALAALSELIEAFRRETDQARAELRRGSDDKDLARWVRAVDALILDLQQLRDGLLPETPVQMSTHDAQTVYLVVDGSPVLLSGPRSSDKAALEQRVLERFCSRNYCADLLEAGWSQTPLAEASEAPPLWRFSDQGGPVCASGDGLELQFRDASDLGRKREVCTQIVAELHTLVNGLRTNIGSGMPVDWPQLAIEPDRGTGQQRVVFNAAGDYLLLSLPSLERTQQFLGHTLPWVAARVADKRYNLVILNAEDKLVLHSQESDSGRP